MLSQAAITTALSLTLLIAAIISICIFLSNNLVKLRGLSNGGLVSIVTLSSDGDGVQHLYIGSDGFTCTHAHGTCGCVPEAAAGAARRCGNPAIRISPDGKFLYCSNRSDSGGRINWFSLEDPMHLQHVGTVSDGLFFPRDFALSRDGQYLVSAGQREETIILWKRNEQTGALSKLRTISDIPEPVCVLNWKETS